MPNIVAKSFDKKCIGKFVSNSKEELVWKLEIEGIMTNITLKLSHLSRKFELFINGMSKKIGTEMFGRVNIDFRHLQCLFIIESDFKKTILKINGTNFESLYWKNNASHQKRFSENITPTFRKY
jgi:hypothetical protein